MPRRALALPLVLAALLTGCAATSPPPAPHTHTPSPSASADGSDTTAGATATVKESCEKFNELDHALAQTDPGDRNAIMDLYTAFDEAGRAAPNDGPPDDQVGGLLTSMSVVVLGYTDPQGPPQTDKDTAKKFFLSASGPCTREGVTLNMEVL